MGVCSFTSLSYFQWFINLQRRIQIENPCQSKSNMWVQPGMCPFSNSHAFMKWLHWICINAGFGTGDSSQSPEPRAKQSFLPQEQAWWHSCVWGCRCVSTLLTCVYPSLPENGWLRTASPRQLYPQKLWNILLLVQHVWKMKMKEFWYIQMVYICYYRYVHSRIVQEKQAQLAD